MQPTASGSSSGSCPIYIYSQEYFPRIHGARALALGQHYSRSMCMCMCMCMCYRHPRLRDVDFVEFSGSQRANYDMQTGWKSIGPWTPCLGFHEIIKEMRVTYPQDLNRFLSDCLEFWYGPRVGETAQIYTLGAGLILVGSHGDWDWYPTTSTGTGVLKN